MSPWLFDVCVDVGCGARGGCSGRLELLSVNGGRFEINQLLFVDSEEKLCRLVNEFGRVCECIES